MEHVDVVIVGAGPVGLLLAIELSVAGVGCVVLEARDTAEDVQKALSIGPLGAEALMRRGMSQALDAAEAQTKALVTPFLAENRGGWAQGAFSREDRDAPADMRPHKKRFAGHFGSIPLPAQPVDARRPTRLIDQCYLQQALEAEASSRGIVIRRGCTACDVQNDGERVTLAVHGRGGERPAQIAARYAVGCDGGRSTLRKKGGFTFDGTPPSLKFYQVSVTFAASESAFPSGWQMQPGGVTAYGPVPGRLFMIDFSGPPEAGQEIPDRADVEAALARICGRAVPLAAYHGGRCWADHTRLADRYRKGRLFLAGDAAHIHAPFGGQGLGLGLVDAANLGWKLAAVMRGTVTGAEAEALLESYETERRPVAESVLANTLAQAALMRPDPRSRALRDVMATMLANADLAAELSAEMKGFSIRYALDEDASEKGMACDDDSLGGLAEDRTLADGETLYGLMQHGAGVFVLSPTMRQECGLAILPPNLVLADTPEEYSALYRPDGCLVWRGGEATPALTRALSRWFGTPSSAQR
ncbi:FAD-dependent monooxygenase [Asaia sp. As-1742]|uniref:FAD-dependent monooxygenase n=1 Tax=Asaia sp. As-1742 TaxID=2608325 RepID=UPI001963ADB5|nr:FAD-dependent monooxygenase [Asaia sp. As-1742]